MSPPPPWRASRPGYASGARPRPRSAAGTAAWGAGEAGGGVERMRGRGILRGTDGPFHNVLKSRPPMPFSAEDGRQLAAALDEVLASL